MILYVAYMMCNHMRFVDSTTLCDTLTFCTLCGMMSMVERVRDIDVPAADEHKEE